MITAIAALPSCGISGIPENQILVLVGADGTGINPNAWAPSAILTMMGIGRIPEQHEAILRYDKGLHMIRPAEWSTTGVAKAIDAIKVKAGVSLAILASERLEFSNRDFILRALQVSTRPITVYLLPVSSPAQVDRPA